MAVLMNEIISKFKEGDFIVKIKDKRFSDFTFDSVELYDVGEIVSFSKSFESYSIKWNSKPVTFPFFFKDIETACEIRTPSVNKQKTLKLLGLK